jgi:hypothetical protein
MNFGVYPVAILGPIVQRDQGQLMAALSQSRDQSCHHAFSTAAAERVDDAGDFQGSNTGGFG